jgi:hypothetical protein
MVWYRRDSDLYGKIGDYFACDMGNEEKNFAFLRCFHKVKDANLKGLNFSLLPSKTTVLINLINLFLTENRMFLDDDSFIYQSDLEGISELQVVNINNFFELTGPLTDYLTKRFPVQLDYLYISFLILEEAENVLNRLKVVPFLLPRNSKKNSKFLNPLNLLK